MRFGPTEIFLVVLVVILLFGAKRIPELMKGIGRGAREFKEGLKGDDEPTNKSSGGSESS